LWQTVARQENRSASRDLVRPTGDRVRESWMSIVHSVLPDARVLDLARAVRWSGSVVSGAAACDFVEMAFAVRVIEESGASRGT
jgi:16S rRNA (guanine966-N2)-methyltransferase